MNESVMIFVVIKVELMNNVYNNKEEEEEEKIGLIILKEN
jgi:hypothetical protein